MYSVFAANYLGFLLGRHATAQNGGAAHGHVAKSGLALAVLEDVRERETVDNESARCASSSSPLVDFARDLVETRAYLSRVAHVRHDVFLHVGREVATRLADVDGRLELVAGEHPDADAGSTQRLDGALHTLLQFVLDSGHAHEPQLALDRLVRFAQALLAPQNVLAGLDDEAIAAFVLLLAERLVGEHERAPAALRERLETAGVLGLLVAALGEHGRVGALAEEQQLATPALANDHAHAFARRVEFEHFQYKYIVSILNLDSNRSKRSTV